MVVYYISRDIYNKLQKAIKFHEDTRGSYFWTPNYDRSIRRWKEEKWNDRAINGEYEIFVQTGKTEKSKKALKISIYQDYDEDRYFIRVTSRFYINGKKTTITKMYNIIENAIILPPKIKDFKEIENKKNILIKAYNELSEDEKLKKVQLGWLESNSQEEDDLILKNIGIPIYISDKEFHNYKRFVEITIKPKNHGLI
ncbi:MAG: hypothetical protein ACTSQP_13470 [Promethearchaeota archaeon]